MKHQNQQMKVGIWNSSFHAHHFLPAFSLRLFLNIANFVIIIRWEIYLQTSNNSQQISAYLTTANKINICCYESRSSQPKNFNFNTSGCNFSTGFVTLSLLVYYAILHTRKNTASPYLMLLIRSEYFRESRKPWKHNNA